MSLIRVISGKSHSFWGNYPIEMVFIKMNSRGKSDDSWLNYTTNRNNWEETILSLLIAIIILKKCTIAPKQAITELTLSNTPSFLFSHKSTLKILNVYFHPMIFTKVLSMSAMLKPLRTIKLFPVLLLLSRISNQSCDDLCQGLSP